MLFNPFAKEIKEVHAFTKGISLKVIVITPLEFEHAYYNVRSPA